MQRIFWWFLILVLLVARESIAQELAFFHLNESDGLSNNTVTAVVTDKNGLLWIGTDHGLNSYDGYSVENFYSKDHRGLLSDQIVRMVCDDRNRIWIQCGNGNLTLLDEKRQFHAINFLDGKAVAVEYLLPFPERPLFLSGGRIYGLHDEGKFIFAPLATKTEPLLTNKFARINQWDKDKLVFSGSGLLFLFDVRKMKVTHQVQVPGVVAAARLSDDVALATSASDDRLYKVSFSSGIVKSYSGIRDQHGETIHKSPGSIMAFHDQLFLITSPSAGVYVFDAENETLIRHQHDVFDDRTISTNHTLYLFSNSEGFNFVSTFGDGLNYFKFNANSLGVKTIFQDSGERGELYAGYVNSIAEDTEGNIWMAGSDAFIKKEAGSGKIALYKHGLGNQQDHRGGIRTLYIDSSDRIWAGYSKGLSVFDKNLEVIANLNKESGLPDDAVNEIRVSPDGSLWISTPRGLCFIDPNTFDITTPGENSPLVAVKDKNCNTVWFRNEEEVWIGTWDGAYKFDLSKGGAEVYTTDNGLIFNEVTGFAGDERDRVYIAARYGFHILEAGKVIRSFKNIHNTWPVDCYSLVSDHHGDIWFSSNVYIARYSPEVEDFVVYDEKTGVNPSGFRFYAARTTRNGELIFGSNKGITFFYPENVSAPDVSISVLVREMVTSDSVYSVIPGERVELPYYTKSAGFSFSAINLGGGQRIFYRCRLDGVDERWVKATSERVTYSNLQPGSYTFSVAASGDGVRWTTASNPATFLIKTPWWGQHWVRIAASLFVCLGVALIVRRRVGRRRQQQENLETEQAINYLATSLHEQRTVDSILWDVAKNCIGRLQFEDCVIYLKDGERNVLVQKAAWGPKTTEEDKILNPIEIPLGQGIVGSVAETGIAEVIRDTTRDKRYIVDDAKRLSEITVPILYDGKVLGIIDSEHSRKGFFTQKHLSILTTIASLCANKITRVKAEQEKQEAQLATLRHEREAVEARLKSLRLQMNPHFLFNSLNAIQQMILAGEDRAATRYLSKFSRLLRMVLLHSDKENITLKEELETLKLYVELESLRFKESFDYDVICGDEIDTEEIKVPVMLIQPFVENAIWHGLLHKKGNRYLKIEFVEGPRENVSCIIEDNGIGREAAGKINNSNHTKKGIAVAEERLKTHGIHSSPGKRLYIDDMYDEDGKAAGTRVVLIIQ